MYIVRGVPILDEHYRDAEWVQDTCLVDRPKLQRMADNTNRTYGQIPITLEHIDPDSPDPSEWMRPLVGWTESLYVERLFNTNRTAIHSAFYIYDEYAPLLDNYPRRSVDADLFVGERIARVALLGGETPGRFLGLLRYSRPVT